MNVMSMEKHASLLVLRVRSMLGYFDGGWFAGDRSLWRRSDVPLVTLFPVLASIWRAFPSRRARAHGSYLVDPASSHMLVSKIKPCMSKHKPLHGEAANGSLGHP